jgi:hypothetical protein
MQFFGHFLNLSRPKYITVMQSFLDQGWPNLLKMGAACERFAEVNELQRDVEWMAQVFRHTLFTKRIFCI